ncbi:MAG: hypothetical protein IT435_08860 [Phycisphaerales bacterium]|nr:hypothetical protein [Phycisphaerales bacterium]
MQQDFDALVAGSRSGVNKAGEHDLWKAAIALPEWCFISSAAGDDAEPVIGAVGGRPYVLVFTEESRAIEFSKRRATQRGVEDVPVLTMAVAEAIEYFRALRDAGVEGALFNSGEYAFQAPLTNIWDMHSRYSRGSGA